MRPLGTFVVNGEAIPIHYVKMLYANDEVYASVIDSNGKQVGMGSNLEVLRDVLNKNKDRILTASKEETPLSKLSTPISTEVKVEEVKTEPAKPVVPKSILAPDEPLGDDLMSSANKKRRPKPSEVNTKIWEKWTPERELEHLNKILPNIIKQDLLKIHKGLIEINKGGAEAWGIYKNGLITISDIAVKGTVFHEAFHLVFDKFTDSVHKGDLFREARIKWGDLGNDKLEEKMADVYRDYTMGIIDKSLGQRILDFFKSIFHLSNSNTPQMDKFFWDINKGKYADKEITIDSENKLVKSLDNPEKIHTFANLDTEVKRLLSKKGIDAEIWENLTKEERLNEFKCVTL